MWGSKWRLEYLSPGDEFWRLVKRSKNLDELTAARDEMKALNQDVPREHIPPAAIATRQPPGKR